MFTELLDYFSQLHDLVFQYIVQPLLVAVGMLDYSEDAYDGVEWVMIGAVEMFFVYLFLRPLEHLIPVTKVSFRSRHTDFVYTAIHKLGVFSVISFFTVAPMVNEIAVWLHAHGLATYNLDQVVSGVTDIPLVSFMIYLLAFDFVEYWYHRGQHSFKWWWALHSVHHSQQEMNLWTDNREHLLDSMVHDLLLAIVSLVIGVPPSQFILLVVATRIVQSVQHANIKISLGSIVEKLLVSPRFHRAHHGIGIGHESKGKNLGGHNFSVLFPVWDILFKTAYYDNRFYETGIRDQVATTDKPARNYGTGFWQQQWLGLTRLLKVFQKQQ